MFHYRPFQAEGINQVALKAGQGKRRILFQAPTGAGKTILFCGLVQRFLTKFPDTKVMILVHREELLNQTIAALHRVAKIEAGALVAGYNQPIQYVNGYPVPFSKAQVVVGMVETTHNRFKKYQQYLGPIGLAIIDECHRGEFHKIYDHFPDSLVVGFTATPISANKKHPMKEFFQDIVSPITIKELIKDGFLAKNITITVENSPHREALRMIAGEFDEKQMGEVFSAPKHVFNCLDAYEKYAVGEKTMIFNCNIEHSLKVTQAFLDAGHNCRHMDGTASKEERKEILEWFARENDAILCNVGIYTTGFDEPTVKNVIFNRATMSLTLWLQVCGRGSRAIEGKTMFKILDLGGNAEYHCDWHHPHDWVDIFWNPDRPKPAKGGAPTKRCKNCEYIMPISMKICPECGHDHTKEEVYDGLPVEMKLLTDNINLEEVMKENTAYNPYRSLHVVKHLMITAFKKHYRHRKCDQSTREILNDRYQVVVKSWCQEQGKKYNQWHKDTTRQWMMEALNKEYGEIKVPEPQST